MKRILALVLVFVMALGLAACSNSNNSNGGGQNSQQGKSLTTKNDYSGAYEKIERITDGVTKVGELLDKNNSKLEE